jgi:hypothetical protein
MCYLLNFSTNPYFSIQPFQQAIPITNHKTFVPATVCLTYQYCACFNSFIPFKRSGCLQQYNIHFFRIHVETFDVLLISDINAGYFALHIHLIYFRTGRNAVGFSEYN